MGETKKRSKRRKPLTGVSTIPAEAAAFAHGEANAVASAGRSAGIKTRPPAGRRDRNSFVTLAPPRYEADGIGAR